MVAEIDNIADLSLVNNTLSISQPKQNQIEEKVSSNKKSQNMRTFTDPNQNGTNDSGIHPDDWENEVLSETEVSEG